MFDWKDPATWGYAFAALLGTWFGIKKLIRRDHTEESAAGFVISLNSAGKDLIESMKKRIEELTAEIHELRHKVDLYVNEHRECQRQNRELNQRLLSLSEKVATLEGVDRMERGHL